MHIVIAKYKEDVSWTASLKTSSFTVFDKSDDINNYIKLPNIGRESHTYLTYIIDNYESLPDYICFLQGDPFVHLTYSINHIDNIYTSVDFFPLCEEFDCDLDGNPQHPNLNIKELIFDRYFIEKPNTIRFVAGAQFIVSKEAIRKRDKKMYELLLADILRTDINDEKFGVNKMPWVLERAWPYIFNTKITSKYDI